MNPLQDAMAFVVKAPDGRGWGVHRDRPDATGTHAFREDGTPRYVTTWLALTRASTKNGCLHCVPRSSDSNFDGAGEELTAEQVQKLGIALPCDRGNLICFSGRLLHWGGAYSDTFSKEEARVAISFAFADTETEELLLSDAVEPMTIESRLALCCSQLLRYYSQAEVRPVLAQLCIAGTLAHARCIRRSCLVSIFLNEGVWRCLPEDSIDSTIPCPKVGRGALLMQSVDGERIAVVTDHVLQLFGWCGEDVGWCLRFECPIDLTSPASI
eukprot:gnl/MRDRNA2_/MRDRNA2_39925_c0_seq2.p1 gnl/MRDRNA2_/MRDRNA2_39925_c0~~gnl/MRDRNA2_/MRDRNA2_39925_c0_seq2.p1  ORF type:complete len:288 (+),score=31.00 gnl/MRDRNA2_/MRDRNA2_39925_c0_seq2:57-866(+)